MADYTSDGLLNISYVDTGTGTDWINRRDQGTAWGKPPCFYPDYLSVFLDPDSNYPRSGNNPRYPGWEAFASNYDPEGFFSFSVFPGPPVTIYGVNANALTLPKNLTTYSVYYGAVIVGYNVQGGEDAHPRIWGRLTETVILGLDSTPVFLEGAISIALTSTA